MESSMKQLCEKRLERTAKALNANRFDAHVVRSREELYGHLRRLMPKGATCAVGGSVSLTETGVLDFLRNGDYVFHDRYAEGIDQQQVHHDAFDCRVYLTSANAVTEDGCLYNMDGRGNRVAAIAYGPEKVIVIAGYNKLVRSLDEARARNRQISAPANAMRLGMKTPCGETGYCADCKSPQRLCCHELISHCQLVAGRITVLLMNEQLGY